MTGKRTLGFWILAVVGVLLLAILAAGQVMAVIDYDVAVSLGLQESEAVIGEFGVAVNRGVGVADAMIYLPLLLMGLVGLWRRTEWGGVAMAGALAITAYWPLVSWFTLLFARGTAGFHFTSFTSYGILLTLFTAYGVWGLWYLYRHRERLVPKTGRRQ